MAEIGKVLATNRKAYHDYTIEEIHEAGIVLTGTEIKSARAGSVNLRDSYVQARGRELWMANVHIAPYEPASRQNVDPYRDRKLLMHRREVKRFAGQAFQKGLTLVPLKLYFKEGRAKLLLGLCRGKQLHDKRQSVKQAEAKRKLVLTEDELAKALGIPIRTMRKHIRSLVKVGCIEVSQEDKPKKSWSAKYRSGAGHT